MTEAGRQESTLLNITVSSGTGTGSISKIWSICRRLRVIPPAEANTYQLKITDGDGDIILLRENELGTLSETVDLSLGIAATVTISSASADGTYKVKFDMH